MYGDWKGRQHHHLQTHSTSLCKKRGKKKKQIEGNGKNATDSSARHDEHSGGGFPRCFEWDTCASLSEGWKSFIVLSPQLVFESSMAAAKEWKIDSMMLWGRCCFLSSYFSPLLFSNIFYSCNNSLEQVYNDLFSFFSSFLRNKLVYAFISFLVFFFHHFYGFSSRFYLSCGGSTLVVEVAG